MIRLHYTPRSHYSRKVRLLLAGWGHEIELVDAGNVGEASAWGENPLMRVPTLVDGHTWVVDSDHIAAYLARRLDPADRFDVHTVDVDVLNARAVMNGVMAAEVEVVLARRSGLDTAGSSRFDKHLEAIQRGLRWLDDHAVLFAGPPTYAGLHLVSLWDHVALYDLVPLEHPRLAERVEALSALPWVAASAPDR